MKFNPLTILAMTKKRHLRALENAYSIMMYLTTECQSVHTSLLFTDHNAELRVFNSIYATQNLEDIKEKVIRENIQYDGAKIEYNDSGIYSTLKFIWIVEEN